MEEDLRRGHCALWSIDQLRLVSSRTAGRLTTYSWSMIPASWINMHPPTRRSISSSYGTPSRLEGVLTICSTVASGCGACGTVDMVGASLCVEDGDQWEK